MSFPSLVPMPHSIALSPGTFDLGNGVNITATGEATSVVKYLCQKLQDSVNPVKISPDYPRSIVLTVATSSNRIKPEGYELTVAADGIQIVSSDASGIFHGVQTLLQLIPENSLEIPCCHIEDAPQFLWRGILLDVSRHYMPVAFIKKLIDAMAMHKLNIFHWHLVDDHGWRLQIDAYPELTEIGSIRSQTMEGYLFRPESEWTYDGKPHGGYYTKDEVREVVRYATERFIKVMPEIELPGHAQAALACYPALSCTGGPFEVSTTWGVHKDVFCAGNEEVFTFLEKVLDETIELFPFEFLHIGGDECLKDRWKACPKCQDRIRSLGLKDEDELQSWMVGRATRYLASRGKRAIGWDEILEGGLPPGVAVMSWHGDEGGIEASKAGHDVVMSPRDKIYFDQYQGDPSTEPLAAGGLVTLRDVYEYHPVPSCLTDSEAKHILGVQGQIWTEYMPTPEVVEYMTFPRLCALAEMGWGKNEVNGYPGFERRLIEHLTRLDAMDIHYRKLGD